MLVAILLAMTSSAAAQSPDPPIAGRPANFSHLVGRFRIAATIEPAEVVVEDPLILRVVVTGDAIGDPPARSRLRILPDDLAASFFVEPLPEQDVANPDDKKWEFAWRLRPKSADVQSIPSLALAYYSPQVRRYQTARSEPLEVAVKPRPKTIVETPLPADLPANFFTLAEWPTEAVASPNPPSLDWLLLGVLLSVILWSVSSPDVQELHALDRPAKMFDELDRNPETALEVVSEYFRRTFRAPAGELTAGDVDRLLQRAGLSRTLRAGWQSWWRDADACRFAASDRTVAALAPRAAELIGETQDAILPPDRKPGVVSVATPIFVVVAVIVVALLFRHEASSPKPPSSPPASWDDACRAFQAGVANHRAGRPCREDFARAAEGFRKCDDGNVPPRANHGNASFLAGQLPDAVAALRAAFQTDPRSESVRRRLAFVRQQVAVPATLVRPTPTWAWAAPSSWLPFANAFGFMTAGIVLPLAVRHRRPRALVAGCAAAFVGVAALGIAIWQHAATDDERRETVAVVRDDTPFRVGNSEHYEANPKAPTLPRGYEVRVLFERGDWLHVTCPGGQTGWVPRATAIAVP